ncbi:MerR family transcriptional regulator [Alkalihalobacillus oceani]|uniref:MerR family transcriptional regulator n=1 Tax=Halalkalibacter oceani TaxID=1653776 RepID=A0A9X2INB7_9BACI|nr:MerR family transcriptional regulator [Halalkalibacter oceani]MCM3713631.1 MerR family transcriptional regulator [Halalkalibacter oceani]
MTSKEGKYNIKAISTMLGIQAGTLRAWERRYRIVKPIRNAAGHRLYSDEHVAILRWLLDKVNKGFTIGQAVGLLEKDHAVSLNSQQEARYEDYAARLGDDMLTALLAFREREAHDLLNQAFSMFSVDKVTVDILGALLIKVGELRKNEEISLAGEQFVTTFLRTKIGMILHSFPVDGFLPRVVTVCGPDEADEWGLMSYKLFLRQKGFEVICLGKKIPADDVEQVIKEVEARMFFTSCMKDGNLPDVMDLIRRLSEAYPQLIIGAGGKAIEQHGPAEKYRVGSTRPEWESWLQKQLRG